MNEESVLQFQKQFKKLIPLLEKITNMICEHSDPFLRWNLLTNFLFNLALRCTISIIEAIGVLEAAKFYTMQLPREIRPLIITSEE